MAGRITEYPNSITTLTVGDLFDVSDYDEVSSYESKKLTWENLLTNIENQATISNLYTSDDTITANRTVTLSTNDLDFDVSAGGNFSVGVGVGTSVEDFQVGVRARFDDSLFLVSGGGVIATQNLPTSNFNTYGVYAKCGTNANTFSHVFGIKTSDNNGFVVARENTTPTLNDKVFQVGATGSGGTANHQLRLVDGQTGGGAAAVEFNTNSGENVINQFGHDVNTRIEGDTNPNLLFIDAGIDSVGIGKPPVDGILDVNLSTEDFAVVDAGSTGATEQDWIEVKVGGNTGYIRVFATQ